MASRYFTGKPCSKGHIAERYAVGTCVECAKIATAEWKLRNPAKVVEASDRRNRKKRGCEEVTTDPPELCEACNIKPVLRLHADHDHDTGKFRGWLCRRCNLGLGSFGDTIDRIEMLLKYLRRG